METTHSAFKGWITVLLMSVALAALISTMNATV